MRSWSVLEQSYRLFSVILAATGVDSALVTRLCLLYAEEIAEG
jgi:hypothetical protein